MGNRPSGLNGYVLAVAAVGASAAVRGALTPLLGDHSLSVTFYPAVMLAAWYGGFAPGLIATALSTILACVLHPSPVTDVQEVAGLTLFTLVNALKFTPRGGCVEIALERQDGLARIAVSDTGEGIGADFLPHVFDAFRQAHAAGATKRQAGLGRAHHRPPPGRAARRRRRGEQWGRRPRGDVRRHAAAGSSRCTNCGAQARHGVTCSSTRRAS